MAATVARKKSGGRVAAKSKGEDRVVSGIRDALTKFKDEYPNAKIDVYRQSKFSVRLRIIDKSFNGKSVKERHQAMWRVLDKMSLEDRNQVTLMVLLTPAEAADAITNYEFENPSWMDEE